MGRKLRHVGWATLVIGGALLGCHKSAVQHKEPPDPLLVTKSHVDGRPHTSHASPVSRIDPPPLPPDADGAASVRRGGAVPVRPAHLVTSMPE